jgi:copper chaperone CopZ
MKIRIFPMLRFLLITSIALMTNGLVHADNGDGTKVPTKEGHRVKLIYYLSGVEGQKEADAIVRAVKALNTVTAASVDTGRGYAKVAFDSQDLSYHQVAQAIADVGIRFEKKYDPGVVISIPDYSKPEVTPKIKAIFADEKLKPLIWIEAIDESKGVFFVHFLPLKLDPAKTGTQGFNGGYLAHPIHMVPPTGLALPFKYSVEDSPEIPVFKAAAPKKS